MNKLLLIAGATIASASITSSAIAAQDTGSATANVLEPITITNTSPLQFGDVDVTGGGTVTIDELGAASGTLTSVGTQSAGTFALTGANGATFSIAIATVTELTNGGGNDLILSAYSNTEGATGTMTGGAITLGVGATITADGGETVGAYTGSYTVDIDYN